MLTIRIESDYCLKLVSLLRLEKEGNVSITIDVRDKISFFSQMIKYPTIAPYLANLLVIIQQAK